jgi:hypothetical protein
MSNKAIRAAIETPLAAWASARTPELKVAWQNRAFKPDAGAAYLRGFLLPADTSGMYLEGGARRYIGLYQISVCVPANSESTAAESIVAEIETLFPEYLRLTASGVTVIVASPVSAGMAQQEPDLYVIPCRFRYRADVT